MKALGAAALMMIGACGADEEAEVVPEIGAGTETAPGTIEVAAEAPLAPPVLGFEPSHGGTVIAAGEHPVEVVTQADGSVEAFVLGPDAPPPGDVQLTVRMPGDDGEVHPVVLIWDPGQARFRGQLRRVQPTPGPVGVVFVVGPETYRGSAPRYVVIGTPGDVVVTNRVGAGGPDVVVVHDEAPEPATVVVHRPAPPQVNVHVERPAPPSAHIVVEHPSPPRPRVVVRQTNAPRANVVVNAPGPPRPAVHVKHRSPRVRVRGGRGGGGRVRVRAH